MGLGLVRGWLCDVVKVLVGVVFVAVLTRVLYIWYPWAVQRVATQGTLFNGLS